MKVINAVVCDDVRKEANGKHIIIGVYPHDMLVRSWVQFFVQHRGEVKIEFRTRVKAQPKKRARFALATFNIEDPSKMNTLTLPPVPVEINEQGLLLFEVREKDGRWKKVREIPISQIPKTE